MQRIGRVNTIVGGLLIVRGEDESHPDIGQSVLDESLTTIGDVVDVIGPVERPYTVVAPAEAPDPSLIETVLYAR